MQIARHQLTWVCAAAALLLSACGAQTPSKTHGRVIKATHAQVTPKPEGAVSPDMVSAVGVGRDASPVELKFALHQALTPNQPGTVEVAIVPVTSVDRLTVSFRSDDGLQVSEGGHVDAIERPEPQMPIVHTVTVVPDRDGIFNLNATVLIDTDTQSVARAFSIPLIAGSGLKAADSPQMSDAGHSPASSK